MRVSVRRLHAVLLAAAVAGPLVLPAAAGAQSADAYLNGAESWTESDCAGDVPIVVGSDAAAQSDIYSAITLAGVLGTDCVVLAGPREGAMPAEQRSRLDAAAAAGGYVVGGFAAVPEAKLAGRQTTRLGGANRWATAQLVGNEARLAADGTRPDVPAIPETALTAPTDVSQPGVYLAGAEPWIASDCAGDVPIIVGSDATAQSDIYSAVTLAGVLSTDCVILAGPRNDVMPASQKARLDDAGANGFVLGGIAAVPTAKIAGRDMTRLGGATRWETAQLVGRRASGDATAGTPTSIEPTGAESEEEMIPDPVLPNRTYLDYIEQTSSFAEECGYWNGVGDDYLSCDDPNDTAALTQMDSDFFGCQYNPAIFRCEGYTHQEFRELKNRLACDSSGWYLGRRYSDEGEYRGDWCFPPNYPQS